MKNKRLYIIWWSNHHFLIGWFTNLFLLIERFIIIQKGTTTFFYWWWTSRVLSYLHGGEMKCGMGIVRWSTYSSCTYILYCWWFRTPTFTSWYGKYHIIYGVLYIPAGAGFLPSTVLCGKRCSHLEWAWRHWTVKRICGKSPTVKRHRSVACVWQINITSCIVPLWNPKQPV